MNRQIILIGGMPTVGKSTIAEAVSKHYDLPWISTDHIRMVMLSVAEREKHKALFEGMDMTAEEYFEKYSLDELAQQEYELAQEVWAGIKRFIDTGWVWRRGCIIEGTSILPSLVSERYSDNPNVKAVFLSDDDAERARQVIYSRGLFSHPDKYNDRFKDLEVKWVKLFDRKIQEEAIQFGFPIVEVSKDSTDIEKVLAALDQ